MDRVAGPDRQRLLLRALTDRSAYVAAMAAERLAQDADIACAPAILERFAWCMEDGAKRDPGCHIRAHIAFALGRMEDAGAVPALRDGLTVVQLEQVGDERRDTGAHLRANCALALGKLRPPGIVRDLALLLFDRSGRLGAEPNPDAGAKIAVRKAAARALALACDPEAATPLHIKLAFPEGEDTEVTQECMQALVDLEELDAAGAVSPYLRVDDPQLAAYAALMVARTRHPEAAGWIEETAARLSANPLRAAVLALTTLRTSQATEAVERLAAHPRQDVRLAVVEALQQMADEPSRATLRRMARRDPSGVVRREAKSALAEA